MFVFGSFLFEMAYLGLAISGVCFAWTIFVGKRKMKAMARQMSRDGVSRYGSLVTHGMTYDHERGVGVKRNEKPSDNWFKRLRR